MLTCLCITKYIIPPTDPTKQSKTCINAPKCPFFVREQIDANEKMKELSGLSSLKAEFVWLSVLHFWMKDSVGVKFQFSVCGVTFSWVIFTVPPHFPGFFLQTDSAHDQTWQPLIPAELNSRQSLNVFLWYTDGRRTEDFSWISRFPVSISEYTGSFPL